MKNKWNVTYYDPSGYGRWIEVVIVATDERAAIKQAKDTLGGVSHSAKAKGSQ